MGIGQKKDAHLLEIDAHLYYLNAHTRARQGSYREALALRELRALRSRITRYEP